MRQIKFRAWDGKNKKMVNNITLYNTQTKWNKFHNEIHPTECKIMQFTGLKDKNGKEIYEGDLYKYKSSEQGKQEQFYKTIETVRFYKGSFGFQEWHTDENGNLKEKLTHHAAHFTTPDLYYIDFDLEIIGNIHENPELLK